MEKNVLLAVTGSVAAIKVPELVQRMLECSDIKVQVQVVATRASLHFFEPQKLPVKCWTDSDEWNSWSVVGDPVVHIELRKWADVMVIAPLDANTLAKVANGLCDNLVTCVVRAWDLSRPLVYCPAMNTFMWDHPLTRDHLSAMDKFGYVQVPPVEKLLACGDRGVGAMASIEDIVKIVTRTLQ